MIPYILKFSACLAVFMLFYKLFLEKESFHQFKRGYLLGTLIASAIIPLITFTTYIEVAPLEMPVYNSEVVTPPYVPEHMFEEPVNYWPTILWSVYGIGVLVFTIRFGMNLSRIARRIKQNPKFKAQSFIHVLLHDLVQPHTFLNYIFFNKTKYEAHEIPEEVLLHEETHAREKHALDILFIEVFQIIFWFNPLLYFIKKDIKLNHEFLADQAVINHGFELKNYQNTLLAFSSNDQEPQLVNAINYSSIKKRFTVMKTHTSKHIIWVRSLVLLPLLAILIYSFSTNKVVEKPIKENIVDQTKIPNLELEQNPLKLILNGKQTSLENLKDDFNRITGGQKSDLNINSKGEDIDYELLQKIFAEIKSNLGNATLSDGILRDPNKTELVKNENNTYSIKSINYSETNGVTQTKPLPKIYGRVCDGCEMSLTKEDIENLTIETNTKEPIASFKIKFAGKPTVSVTGNKLNATAIKHLNNSKNGDYIQLFNLKTPTTRIKPPVIIKLIDKSEVPPPPPPPIPANATPEQKDLYKKVHEEYYKKYKVVNGMVVKKENYLNIERDIKEPKMVVAKAPEKQVPPPPPPPIPADATPEQKEKYQKVSEEYYKKYKVENGKVSKREPLPPKPPKSPLDHVIEMAKKNATFYLEGKEISSDKAIEILKVNKSMNISTKNSSSKNPKVYLSKEPITIKEK